MKNIKIQSLTLMMLVAMAYVDPAPYNTDNLLKKIEAYAIDVLKETKHQNITVDVIPSLRGTTCVKEFFCFAEEALNKAKREYTIPRIKHLHSNLQQYNKMKRVHCSYKSTDNQTLENLLENIKACAILAKNEE